MVPHHRGRYVYPLHVFVARLDRCVARHRVQGTTAPTLRTAAVAEFFVGVCAREMHDRSRDMQRHRCDLSLQLRLDMHLQHRCSEPRRGVAEGCAYLVVLDHGFEA